MPGYSDKSGQCKGNVKEGVIYVWLKNIPKRDFCASVSIAEIDNSLGVYGNSNYVLYEIAKEIILDANERWIECTKEPDLKETRRRLYESDRLFGKDSAFQIHQIESAARCLKGLYELATGNKPMSWFEKSVKRAVFQQ